jgi:hypothetical protein
LTLAGAGYAISSEKDAHFGFGAFHHVYCQTQSIVWTLVPIWRIANMNSIYIFVSSYPNIMKIIA